MSTAIIHRGVIVKVHPASVTVSITPDKQECGGCAIARMCSQSETIEVPMLSPSPSLVGQHVDVSFGASDQHRAVITFFVVPLLLIVLITGLCIWLFGLSEVISALIGIGVLFLWYCLMGVLYRRVHTNIHIIKN